MARPTSYNQEIADRICHVVATNPVGLPTICKMFPELPSPDCIREWRWKFQEFAVKYAEAKRFQAEIMAESIEDIIDETKQFMYTDEHGNLKLDSGVLGLARLTVDSRKWTASKLAPKIYGDKVSQEDKSSLGDTLTKIQSMVNEFNKTNEREV